MLHGLEQGESEVREVILHLRRHFRKDLSGGNPVALQIPQRGLQHSLGDALDHPLKLGETCPALWSPADIDLGEELAEDLGLLTFAHMRVTDSMASAFLAFFIGYFNRLYSSERRFSFFLTTHSLIP